MIFFHGLVATTGLAGMVFTKGLPWVERIGSILARLRYSFSRIADSTPLEDPLLFFISISLLIWIISAAAGYFHTRHGSTWFVLVPAVLAFMMIDRYDLSGKMRSLYLFFFLLTVVMLLMRSALMQKRRQWVDEEILIPPGINFELTRTAGLIVLVLLTTIWLLPAFSKISDPAARFWREITRPLDNTREKIANALAPLKSSNTSGMVLFYDTMSIGHTTRQESTVVFTAHSFARDPLLYRYYWRIRSYDLYENGVWKTSADVEINNDNEFSQPAIDDWKSRRPVTFEITTESDMTNMLVTEQSPYQVSLPSEIFGVEITPSLVDVDYLKPVDPLLRGTSYRVSSLKSIPSVPQLQNTGLDYPEWVRANYLKLPENINPLVFQLAGTIIRGKNNPYDRVDAITQYLRENYHYLSNLPPTPQNEDPIDVFLFSDYQGFCNHFATAEVLLLRSIGIPARIAIGFAEGDYDEEAGLFIIRIKDIHAWPEVYFQDYGWVIFEPTTNQEPLIFEEPVPEVEPLIKEHLLDNLPFLETPETDQNNNAAADQLPLKRMPFRSTQRFFPLFLLILVEVGSVSIIFMLLLRIPERTPSMVAIMENSMKWSGIKPPLLLSRWSAYLKRLPMEQAFLVPDLLFSLLKLPAESGQTVRERVELWVKILPEIQPFSSVLLREYEKELYGGGNGNYALASHASRVINRKIIRAAVFRLLHIKDKRRN